MLVSIVMPVFNGEQFIGDAIDSVLAQTYTDFELLVVDDSSTDRSYSIAGAFARKDHRVSVLASEGQGSVSAARNTGIKASSGRFIAFLDCDDLWYPSKLETQVTFLVSTQAVACCSAYHRISVEGKLIGTVRVPLRIDFAKLMDRNYVGNLTGVYSVDLLGKRYQKDSRHEDYVMWLDIARESPIFGLPEVTGAYRVVNTSVSSDKLASTLWHYDVLRADCNLSIPHALCRTLTRSLVLLFERFRDRL